MPQSRYMESESYKIDTLMRDIISENIDSQYEILES